MINLSFTGEVFSVETKPHTSPDGSQSLQANLKFTISQRVSDRSGTWGYKNSWVEAVAFGRNAEYWATFQRGDVIEGTGEPDIQPYTSDKRGPDYSIKLLGHGSLTPSIRKVSRLDGNGDASQGAAPAAVPAATPAAGKKTGKAMVDFDADEDLFATN